MIHQVIGSPAEELISKSETFILDVRTKEEFARGALQRAYLLPIDQLEKKSDQLPKDKSTPILIYCAHGVRSMFGAAFLERNGFLNIYNLEGGMATHLSQISKRK